MSQISKLEYRLPEHLGGESLVASLATRFHLQDESRPPRGLNLLDTFDWRLYQAGWWLTLENESGMQRLTLLSVADGEVLARQPSLKVPGFSADLPQGRLRGLLEPVMEMRTLLPLVLVEMEVDGYRVLNEDLKTVVRLELVRSRARRTKGARPQDMPDYLRVLPIKGYTDDFAAVQGRLDSEGDTTRSTTGLFSDALAALGRQPGDYSSKLNIQLQPGQTALAASKQIYVHLLETMLANLDGTKADLDSEFLHDFRVAVRRTRSALTQIRDVIEDAPLAEFKEGFAWLGSVTGPTRDLDVYLLGIDGYRQSLPEELQDALQPFREFLERHQKEEQESLKRRLNSPNFHKLIKEWRAFLDDESVDGPANARRPVETVAGGRIWKLYKRVLKEGRAITAESHADELHELRKSCKKLRYMIEFFSSLYPEAEIKPLIKSLKQLLDNLGNHQDLEVQAGQLEGFATRMVEEAEVPPRTLLAMGVLVGDLLRRQNLAREEFAERFAKFDTSEDESRYRSLFKRGGRA